jgi:AcrR family transcriptional regulator
MPEDRGSVRAAEIVEAAAGLFAQKGFDGVSVRDICSALGLNTSIVSYYFGGKSGLYLAVLRRLFQTLAEYQAPMDAAGPPEKLAALLQARLEAARKTPWLAALLRRESGRPSPEFQEARREFGPAPGERLAEVIRDGQRRGLFQAGPAGLLAELLEAMLNASPSEAGADHLAAIKTLVFEGLLTARPAEPEARPAMGKQSAIGRDRLGLS